MKSTREALRRRGFVTDEEIASLRGLPIERLLELLRSDCPATRTAAARNLSDEAASIAEELLQQLSVELCLYTKIAICESLERGDIDTAKAMTRYLGKIGDNQHRRLPDTVSRKLSFPLPRDIVARSMGKMNASVLPVLNGIVGDGDVVQISEALDAIGYLVFYQARLATSENAKPIIDAAKEHRANELIVWKAIVCLSAFPRLECRQFLQQFAHEHTILGMEARRSLHLLEKRYGL